MRKKFHFLIRSAINFKLGLNLISYVLRILLLLLNGEWFLFGVFDYNNGLLDLIGVLDDFIGVYDLF